MSAPRVVLIGPMGAGKSTVGGLLARAWGVELRDTDRDIEAAQGDGDKLGARGDDGPFEGQHARGATGSENEAAAEIGVG